MFDKYLCNVNKKDTKVALPVLFFCRAPDREQDELSYLGAKIYPNGNTGIVAINRINAYARFSVREIIKC